jgi:coenzyme F420 biosynthesis associated uncharacterized protein
VIDWILAERLAAFLAGRGEAPRGPGGMASARGLEAMAADAEVRVARYTGLTPTRPLPAPEGITRAEWVRANVSSMRCLLDPVLERAGERLRQAPNGAAPSRALAPAVSLGVSLVVTTEVGVVLGFLAQRVLGQYELVLLDERPEAHPPRLLFVLPNLAGAVTSLEAPEEEFLTWVTLHEVTHAVQFAGVPWLQGYLAGLVSELMRSAELRMDGPRSRLPSRTQLARSLRAVREGDVVGIFASPGERATLDRVQAVMAVIEGHAEHVMDAVAPDLLPSLPRLRAALNRRRRTQSRLSRVLGKLLGLELKLRQYEQGKFFCDAIVEAAGTEALVRVFSSPEALPNLAELADPDAWVARLGLAAALPGHAGP